LIRKSGSWSDKIPFFYRLGYHWTGKGKQTCWKLFTKANNDILKAFAELEQTLVPSNEVVQGLEEFVCLLFAPRVNIKDLGQLRWHLFKKNKAEVEKLPPQSSTGGTHSKSPLPGNDLVTCRHSKTKFANTHQLWMG